MVLAFVEHPKLCHSWCQCVLKPAEMWSYTDPLSLDLYDVDCSQVQARAACLKFVLCSPLARVVLNKVTLNDLKFLHLYSCLLRLDSFKTSSFGSWWGTVLWWHKSAPSAPLDSSPPPPQLVLCSQFDASLALNLIQNPHGKTVGRWLIFLFVF